MLNRWLLSVFTITVLLATAGVATPIETNVTAPDTPRQLLALANHYLELVETDPSTPSAALPLYQRILGQFAESDQVPWARLGVATCLLHLQRYDESIQECLNIEKAYPDTTLAAWTSVVEGDCYIKLGDDATALALLCDAANKYSALWDRSSVDAVRRKIGEIYLRFIGNQNAKGDAAATLIAFRDDQRIVPWALATTATAWARIGVMPTAMAYFNTLQKNHPDAKREIAWAAMQIGQCCGDTFSAKVRKGEERQAIIDLLSLPRQIVPEDTYLVAGAELGLCRYLRVCEKNNKDVAEILQKTIDTCSPTVWDPEIRYICGQALMSMREYQKAADQFRVVGEKWSSCGYSSPSLYALGCCLMDLDKPADARLAFEELLENRGESDWRILAEPKIASCYAKEGNYEKAAEIMNRAAQRTSAFSTDSPVVPTANYRDSQQRLALKLQEYALKFSELAAKQEMGVEK